MPPVLSKREGERRSAVRIVKIGAPSANPEIPKLCDRLRTLAEEEGDGGAADLLVCDASALTDANAATVDALARLQLAARRLGREVRIEHASERLRGLLTLLGLSGAVGCDPDPPANLDRGNDA